MTISKSEKELQALQSDMKKVELIWVPKVEELLSRINQNFVQFFSFIGCAGQVTLAKEGEDYDRWGVNILVKFREEEQLHSLDSERQSGGVSRK